MACRGVLFSIDSPTAETLCSMDDDDELVDYIHEVIEEPYFEQHPEWVAETDKSWDFMHRALTDGEFGRDNGTYPLNHLILGGQSLFSGDDYIITLKTPQQVADVAVLLPTITEDVFRECFRRIPASDLEHSFQNDFEYTWDWFTGVREFWLRASSDGRFVIFMVDQ